MLSPEDNELLCWVGPGTLMGELFRRFWLPAMIPSEIPRPDCDPARRKLIQMAKDLAKGKEPALPRYPAAFGVRAIDVTTPIEDQDTVVETYSETLRLPAA